MFKSARWRSEKNKVKSVFRLQFHVTQVSQLAVDSLTVSVIPVEIGKPSVRLEKASVKDGGCRWESPVYETVKFSRDPRTGKITEKIYRFSVTNGSAKNGVLGEASIDFAAYSEANKASTVSLPLKNSNSDAILHVLIHRIQGNVEDQREVEECDDIKPKSQDRSLQTHLSNGHIDDILAIDGPISKATNHNGELNGIHRKSSGSDITFSSSDSSSGVDTPRDLGLRNDDAHQDRSPYLSSLSNSSVPQKKVTRDSITDDWAGGSDDSMMRENSQTASGLAEIEKLKAELGVLARQSSMSELELQTLRKQIVKEGKRNVDLSREVGSLKDERDGYKEECERLKSFQKRPDEARANNRLSLEGGDLRALVEEIRQELNHEKDLNSNLRLQLQKTQEANSELILAIQDLEEMLEQKNKERAVQTNGSENVGCCESDEDEEQKALEKLVKEHRDANETSLLEQKVTDLYNEIEIYRRDRDELEMQMEQIALDYEILKQENHDISYKLEQSQIQEQLKMQYECSPINDELASHIESLERELKTHSEEISSSSATIKDLESHVESLEEELKMRSKEKTDALVMVKELESQITSLGEEIETRVKECSDSSATIKELESRIQSLSEELETRTKECYELESRVTSLDEELRERSNESSKALVTVKALESQIVMLEKEFSESLVTRKEIESHIEGLDEELKKRSKESSDSLVSINELEFHIQSLEEELEERALVFEADLEALVVAKVEQEQRAIRAEESMRKMKWKNASTAEKLQDEFRRLSTQMASTFEANEKVAMKSIQEANELRAQKSQLEEMVRRSKREIQVVRDDYEAKLSMLSGQTVVETTQIQHTSSVNDIDSKQHEDEISRLKFEIERLKTENNRVSEQAEENRSLVAELEKLKKSVKDDERSLSELENLKSQCDSLKNSLSEEGIEKDKLRKQVFQLKNDLKKKDDAIANIEKKLKETNGRTAISDGIKTTLKNNKLVGPVPRGPKEVISLKEKIKLLEGQIKSKETALEISASTFLEKEKDLQSKIADLETRLEELNQNSAFQKVVKDAGTLTSKEEMSPMKREENALLENEDSKVEDLASELALLEEKNQFMEGELKEMQERYSEISLKFAEVEGERQKLVMTVRYLKNNKKN